MKRSVSYQNMPILNFCSLFLFILSGVIAGCTTVHKDFAPFQPAQKTADKIEAKAAIVLPDELCSLNYTEQTVGGRII